LELLSGSDEELARIDKEERSVAERLARDAELLSKKRAEGARKLRLRMMTELADLAMPRTEFVVALDRIEDAASPVELDGIRIACDANGLDRVEFMISPNPGEAVKPLAKIASGGEMSRIMLALKNILAPLDQVPTLIFDEIDTGIGGRTADVLGRKIASVAGHRQVLCVTHLAQIACQAGHHFQVVKETLADRTVSRLRLLGAAERVEEIARMIGGEKITAVSLRHAEEMLRSAGATADRP
jgi:DNA repair protein RecN (Recombination protein N)